MIVLRVTATAVLVGGLVWITDFGSLAANLAGADIVWISIAAALLPVNVGLEAWKWRLLLGFGGRQATIDAFGSLLAGYALGLFSPARLGEYVGRTLYLQSHGFETAVKTGVDRMYSMLAYVVGGLVGLAVILASGVADFAPAWGYVAVIGTLAAVLLAVLAARLDLLYRPLSWLWRTRNWISSVEFLRSIDSRRSAMLLLLSVTRYLVFSTQLVVLVVAFGGAAPIGLLYAAVALIFLIKTLVPSFTFADLGIRETASVFLLGLLGIEPAVALNASLTLFALNLLLPAMAGVVILPRLRLPSAAKSLFKARSGSVAR